MLDVKPLPSPTPSSSESSSSTSSPAHVVVGVSYHHNASFQEQHDSSYEESPYASQNESYHTSHDESSHSSQDESPHSSSNSPTSPHLSIRSSIVGSVPNSSSSSTGPSPIRFPFPTHLPMHPELKPMRSCLPNAIPPGPMYLPRVRFISYLLESKPLPRPPRPTASTKEACQSTQPPEVSAKGIIPTPPRSMTSSLSSLSLLSSTPPPSPPHTPPSHSTVPSTSLPLTSALLSRLSSNPTHWKSLPLLNESSSFPPILPLTSSLSQATMPLAPHESLKKSVSEPLFQN